jgi:outer membrane lipoprotein-sorting protein
MLKKTVLTLIVAALLSSGSFFSLPARVHAEEFSADIVTEMQTGSVNGKMYFKNTRVNRNEIMGMINIMKYPQVYQLFTGTKKYHVSDVTELETDGPMAGVADFEIWAKENNLQKTGTESIEGFACDIYEGTIEVDEETGETAPMKIWLSRKLQYPLKSETVMPDPVGRVVSLVKNIKTGKQPDHLFEIPEGYTRAASMEQAMGMPDMSQFSEEKMPSAEQMDEMMKQVQEMMKNMKQE